jgi:hypothetical protein
MPLYVQEVSRVTRVLDEFDIVKRLRQYICHHVTGLAVDKLHKSTLHLFSNEVVDDIHGRDTESPVDVAIAAVLSQYITMTSENFSSSNMLRRVNSSFTPTSMPCTRDRATDF